jgi:hypothetical protein
MKGSSDMRLRQRRRLWLLAVIVAVVLTTALLLLVLAPQVVFNGPPTGTGDPGNKRLNELSADPVFASLPPGAHLSGPIARTPARYRQPGFQTGGWDGPSVVVTFVSDQPASAIYQFYAARAADVGWHATAQGSLGYTDNWTKTYSDHATGYLSLDSLENGPKGFTYTLSGSITTVTQ